MGRMNTIRNVENFINKLIGIEITEVVDLQNMNTILEKTAKQDVLKSKRVQQVLSNLLESSQNAGCTTYIVGINGKNWAVTADSMESLKPFLPQLKNINKLQQSIKPEKLNGRCTNVSRLTVLSGICQGIYNRGVQIGDLKKSINLEYGLHDISFVDNPRTGHRMFLDLSAKDYSFAIEPGQAATAVLEGLLVVDDILSTDNINWLYRCQFSRDPYSLEQNSVRLKNKLEAELCKD